MLIAMEHMVRLDAKDTLEFIEKVTGLVDMIGVDTMNVDLEQFQGFVPRERTRIAEAMLKSFIATLKCKSIEDTAKLLLRVAGIVEFHVQIAM